MVMMRTLKMQLLSRSLVMVVVVVAALFLIAGCSTDVIPAAPTPKSRKIPIERDVPSERLFKQYSRDFQDTYGRDAPWKTYMLGYLSVRFLARDGLERFNGLSKNEKEQYPGVKRFVKELESYEGGPWSYAAYQSLQTLNDPKARESFRSDINFQPFQNFAIGKWLKTRIESDKPLPDFNAMEVDPEIRRPILTASALILTAQYYHQSYQTITEPTVLDEHYQKDIRWLLKKWRQNYLRIRTIWPQGLDLTVLSSQSLSPLHESAEEKPAGMGKRVNPADRRYGRSTLPFRNIYDVSMENIPPRVRDLQTKAIEEYISGRLHSSLRMWLQGLTYAMKYQLVQQFTDQWSDRESNIAFYARNGLEDIKNVIQMN